MESLSDIVAQMRGRGEDGRMDRRLWLDYADRIEAAWKRERDEIEAQALSIGGIVEASRHKPGNAAAMREVLRRFLIWAQQDLWENACEGTNHRQLANAIVNEVSAALSVPARQCDVGTPDELGMRYKAFCRKHFTPDQLGGNCRKCPLKDRRGWSCQLAWAQTPYEAKEGGAE